MNQWYHFQPTSNQKSLYLILTHFWFYLISLLDCPSTESEIGKSKINSLFSHEYTEEDFSKPDLGTNLYNEIQLLQKDGEDILFYGVKGEMKDFFIIDDLIFNYGWVGAVRVKDNNFITLLVTLNKFLEEDFKKFKVFSLKSDDFDIFVTKVWTNRAKLVQFYV